MLQKNENNKKYSATCLGNRRNHSNYDQKNTDSHLTITLLVGDTFSVKAEGGFRLTGHLLKRQYGSRRQP